MNQSAKDDEAIDPRDDPAQTPASDDSHKEGSAPIGEAEANDGPVHSRSDDPGQSSYGGFKDEGPADDANHAADAGDTTVAGDGGIPTSNVGSNLSGEKDTDRKSDERAPPKDGH